MNREPSTKPLISVVIPARDEERELPGCLSSIQRSAQHLPGSIEVIVVLNRCSDGTEELARQSGCRIAHDDSKNLSKIRNSGARLAQADILVTIDADSRMSEGLLPRVLVELRRPEVIGGGVLILPKRWSLGIMLTGVCLLPYLLFERISGGLFFCRTQDFNTLGGFDESLASVEDIDFARRLRKLGASRNQRFKTLWLHPIVTSCRKFDRLGDWYFLRHPRLFRTLLTGHNQAAADKIWYDFQR